PSSRDPARRAHPQGLRQLSRRRTRIGRMRSTNSAKPAKDDPSARRAALLDSQRRVLERIASGAPLEDVLLTLVRLIEDQTEMRCGVLLADIGQTRLQFVAAPNVPRDYRLAVEPYLAIGPKLTTC